MFSDYKAPFFQFAHAMAFPRLEQDFTDFLADIYQARTANTLDKQALYQWFVRCEHIPLHLRTIIQNMIIDPALPLDAAAAAQQQYLHDSTDYAAVWRELKALAQERQALYAQDTRRWLAAQMGVDDVSVPQVQAALRGLTRADFITKNSEGQWAVNHPDMLGWIREQMQAPARPSRPPLSAGLPKPPSCRVSAKIAPFHPQVIHRKSSCPITFLS